MKKTIITVVGKDTVGIIAKVCTYLAENQINILDISQTIVQDYFNMMMIVDTNHSTKVFGDMADELAALGEKRYSTRCTGFNDVFLIGGMYFPFCTCQVIGVLLYKIFDRFV